MHLNIRSKLRRSATPEKLQEIGVYFKRHLKYPNLYQFSYDQIESSKFKSNPIVQEARGIILDSERNWEPVAFPFKRFFNYGEPDVPQINWNTAVAQQKLDGSLMILYHYDNKWQIATRGSPDASGSVGDYGFTFAELFWETFFKLGYKKESLEKNLTYIWELTSPYNRVVVRYPESSLTLIGVRCVQNCARWNNRELPVTLFHSHFNVVQQFPCNSIENVLEAAKALDPMNEEGYVIVDNQFNRVKVKSPKYVLIHHMVDGFGVRRIIELIKMGEESEILIYYPEYKEIFDKISVSINYIIEDTEACYERIKHHESQKDFALEAVKHRLSGALFSLRKGNVKSVKEFLLKLPAEKIQTLVEDYENNWKIG